MIHCDFIRNLFNLDICCCDSCHEDLIYGLENDIYIPMCEWGGVGEDLPFLELCCAFNDFMENLTEKQKQKIKVNYE